MAAREAYLTEEVEESNVRHGSSVEQMGYNDGIQGVKAHRIEVVDGLRRVHEGECKQRIIRHVVYRSGGRKGLQKWRLCMIPTITVGWRRRRVTYAQFL